MMDSSSDFPKIGFARLLKPFDSSTDDVVKLTKAFALATRTYRGQLYNKSEPYINHQLRVALILVEELQIRDAELASAALLHNAPVTWQALQEYGDRIRSIVLAAAEPKTRSEETLEKYYSDIAKAPKDVRYVKLADRLDSVRAIKGQAFRAARYKEEIQKYVVPIASATDDRLAFKLSVALYELK
ncbi:MAG TPA: HD domain-containing protein [Nitrososphaera sp.]|jgi:(p)ppGpp synthase/HD superfamily hydrolase